MRFASSMNPLHKHAKQGGWRCALWTLLALVLSVRLVLAASYPLQRSGLPTLAPMLEAVTPAVVNVSVYASAAVTEYANPLLRDPFFRRFFNLPDEGRRPPSESVGSGVIVDALKGYILTNHHVLERAERVVVTLKDQRRFEARVLGSDQGTDIAVLQIDAEGLTALAIGHSKMLRVGDFVVAIGNPFGLGQTVTSGIVSALGRSGLIFEGYEDFIQTDASINPGNSGGALVALDGTLVGINTAIIAPGGGNVGIGFAVPMHIATAIRDQIVQYGKVQRGRIGVMLQNLNAELAEGLQLELQSGALIASVIDGSAAARAGLQVGDVITAVDGEPVASASDLRRSIGLVRAGNTVRLTYVRTKQQYVVSVELAAPQLRSYAAFHPKLEGALMRDLERGDRYYNSFEGVLVAEVGSSSPAYHSGLRDGDLIAFINRRRVRNLEDAGVLFEHADQVIEFMLLRDGARLRLRLD